MIRGLKNLIKNIIGINIYITIDYSLIFTICIICNIKMDLQEVGRGRGDWMELAQDRDGWQALVGTVRNFWVP